MSYIDFKKLINSFGYKSFKFLWYRNPRKALSRGLKPLNSDFNILQLAEVVFGFDVIDVYMNQGVIDTSSKKLNDVEFHFETWLRLWLVIGLGVFSMKCVLCGEID